MRPSRWFLPEQPDVVAMIRGQLQLTVDALESFAAWAAGQPGGGEAVAAAEQRSEESKRAMMRAIREAFVLPIEPEDAFALSRGLDWIVNDAADLVAEATVLEYAPDAGIAEMATLMQEAVAQLDEAASHLANNTQKGIDAAEAAIAIERQIGAAYQRRMAELLDVEDRNARIAQRELYRRCSAIGDTIVEVAERIMYAVIKQS